MSTSAKHAVRVAIVVALLLGLALFARHVDWRAVAVAVRSADARFLAAALVFNLLSLALKGVRWWVFLRPLGVRSLSLVLRATVAGASVNNLVVAQGGEGARVLLVSRGAGVSSAGVLAALAAERVLDAVSYLVLLVSAAWLLALPEVLARVRTVASVVLGAVAAISIWAVCRPECSEGPAPDAVRQVQPIRSYLRRFASGFTTLASPARFASAMALSLAAWALQVTTYHLVALGAHLAVPLAGSVTAMLLVGMSFLVRATPGNVGIFQVVYALALQSFGIAEGPAIAAALLIQTVQVLPVLFVGTLVAPSFAREKGPT